jgi:DNA repair protein RadC
LRRPQPITPEAAGFILRQSGYRPVAPERFAVILLNADDTLAGVELVAVGDAKSVAVWTAHVFRAAFLRDIPKLMLAHTHPGPSYPSSADFKLTKTMRREGADRGIEITDHIVLGTDGVTSIKALTWGWR